MSSEHLARFKGFIVLPKSGVMGKTYIFYINHLTSFHFIYLFLHHSILKSLVHIPIMFSKRQVKNVISLKFSNILNIRNDIFK